MKATYETTCTNHSGGPASPHTVACFAMLPIDQGPKEREAWDGSRLFALDDPMCQTSALWNIAISLAVIADLMKAKT